MCDPEPIVSYAQNLEDVVLARTFRDQRSGFYVDVGANDPMVGSLTRHFYERGWRGINIEPGRVFERLAVCRPRDVNLNVAVSDHGGRLAFFEPALAAESAAATLAVGDADFARRRKGTRRMVDTLTLAEVFTRHAPETIDFLSVDVEGHERAVLAGNDWRRWRPRVLVIEAMRPHTTTPCHDLWEDLVLAAGYRFALFDGLNRFYVRAEDGALLPRLGAPANVTDGYLTADSQRLRQLQAELGAVGTRALAIGLGVARLLHAAHRLLPHR